MSRSLSAVLAAVFLLFAPVGAGQANDPVSFVNGCWPGTTWDEHGIAIKAD